MIVVGIDPGANGAAVFRTSVSTEVCSFRNKSWPEIVSYFERWHYWIDFSFIEAVGAMPRDAKATAFTFGENTGIVKGIMHAFDIKFAEVHSQKWQRHFGLGAKYDSKTLRKNAQKQKAQELFPSIKVTLDIADALLIAQYGYNTMSS